MNKEQATSKLLNKKTVFQGKVIQLNLEQIRLPNQQECELEIIHHPGGAACVALNQQGEICLLRQYRHAADGWLWELPAGKLEPDEPAALTAQRELLEEAGVTAKSWRELGKTHSSPGVFTEIIHLYLATDLEQVGHNHEEHEVIEIHWVTLKSALEWADQGVISDAKTLIGIYRAARYLAGDTDSAL